MIEKIDHDKLGISRLATQFRESKNLIAYIQILLSEANNIEDMLFQLLDERSLDTAIGAQLDVIGEIVGQSRIFIDADAFKYFAFLGSPIGDTFGDVNNPSLGSNFFSLGEPTTGFRKLTDAEYRVFIRARISRNSTTATPEEIIQQIRLIFDAPTVFITEGQKASYIVNIGKILSANEKVLLTNDIIPKPLGVRVDYISQFDPGNYFGFLGMPDGLGFGDVNDPNAGGNFSEIIV